MELGVLGINGTYENEELLTREACTRISLDCDYCVRHVGISDASLGYFLGPDGRFCETLDSILSPLLMSLEPSE